MNVSLGSFRRILCLGAHADDIEIGCGATLLSLVEKSSDAQMQWEVFSAPESRSDEARESAEAFLSNVGDSHVHVHAYRESFFPVEWAAIKERFERIKRDFDPDLILTHFRDDRHQDHRVLSDLAWNTFRSQLILEYEIPKYDGDLGQPNVFVPITEEIAEEKVNLLMKHFETQGNKHWFTPDLFFSLMRLRGMECGHRYAEAFYGRKMILA